MPQIKFGSAAKSRRKRDRKKVEIRKKEFQFHGKTIEDLQKLSVEELLPMLPSRSRRTLKRGLSKDENKLMNDIKNAKQGDLIKTHCRNMIVLPSFVGHNILIHAGYGLGAQKRRVDSTGTNAVHVDIMSSHFAGQGLGESDQSALGR